MVNDLAAYILTLTIPTQASRQCHQWCSRKMRFRGTPLMVSAEREPIWGFGGLAPNGVQGQSPGLGDLGAAAPQKRTIFQRDICHFNVFHDSSGINLLHESVLNFFA